MLGTGTVRLHTPQGKQIDLYEVLHVPDISKNLVSVTQLTRGDQIQVTFEHGACHVKEGPNVIMQGCLVEDLYLLDVNTLRLST